MTMIRMSKFCFIIIIFCLVTNEALFINHEKRNIKSHYITNNSIPTYEDRRSRINFCESEELKKEIAGYAPIAKKIFYTVMEGAWKHYTWSSLADFIDRFGARPAGSKVLEEAIDYMLIKLKYHNLDNVHTEVAPVPSWIRIKESCKLLSPVNEELKVLGLGGSVSTPAGGITAPAIVVSSFDELKRRKKEVSGKIVVFDEPWISYGETVKYRDFAAAETAALGGVASLIRSVTPFSIYTTHTGWQDYKENVTKIPTAALTVEDVAKLHRMVDRGEKLVIHLEMKEADMGMVESRNTVSEVKGRVKADEVVLVSGHLDSWDVGKGAMDDGGGAFISWNAAAVLKFLKLQPRRTLRSVLWTGEEEGLWGAQAYFTQHKNELDKFNAVMESDEGTFNPRGLSFSGNKQAACVIKEILKLMATLNATNFHQPEDGGPDIGLWTRVGVPGLALLNDNERYFWYHHSEGDTMQVEDPDNLDKCLAVWTVAAYVLADMKEQLPR